MTRAALLTVTLALALNVACSMDNALTQLGDGVELPDTGAFDAASNAMGGPPDGAGMEGPMSCEADADCEAACPPEALECLCAETPMGDAICVPGCERDADCPSGPQGEAMICEPDHLVCVPEEML